MQKFKALFRSELFIAILLLILVSAVAYLPFISHFGFFNDDWYEMYAAGARGPMVFIDIFSIDRPARALLMIPLYLLFGQNPLPYNVTAYLFRLLGGLSVLWSLRLVWPQHKRSAMLAALFFLIYPGFLSQPQAIDYQSHIAGIFFATLSIALTLKAVTSRNPTLRIFISGLSIFFGLAYLSQMEYYAGYEVARLALLFLLAKQTEKTWLARLKRAGLWYLPFATVPLVFFTWRLFFFQDVRKATDIGMQLGNIIAIPRHTILVWTTTLVQNIVDVTLLAWVVPLYNAFARLSPIDMLVGLALVFAVILVAWALLRRVALEPEAGFPGQGEIFWVGLVIIVGGLLPVIVANRSVDFSAFSRYSVISMFGTAMILAIFIERLRGLGLQLGFALLLIGIAVFTHYANGLLYARSSDLYDSFWWQVSWRIPKMEKGTTLVINAPVKQLGEDYTVWAPANFIYYPQSQSPRDIQPGIYAALLDQETVKKVLAHESQQYATRRGSITTYNNYKKLLVLSQPTTASCVQVIDSQQPEFSSSEDERIMLLAPYSQTKQIVLNAKFAVPPLYPFGLEPSHDWCYYYEKAAYARQIGDWKTVASIGDDVTKLGLAPSDAIEWMPFLQAYAVMGNDAKLSDLAPSIVSDPFIAQQACAILRGMKGLKDPVVNVINSQYCVDN